MTDLSQYARAGDTFKFETIGDTLKGEIVQIKDPHERVNKFNGQDELVMSITVRTGDGEEWSVWPRMQPYSSMGGAIADATEDYDSQIKVGGTLAIQYTEDLDTGKPQPARIYVADYRPPTRAVDVSTPEPGVTQAPGLLEDDAPF